VSLRSPVRPWPLAAFPIGYVSLLPAVQLPEPAGEHEAEVFEWRVASVSWRFSPSRAVMRGAVRLPAGMCIPAGAIWFGARHEIAGWLTPPDPGGPDAGRPDAGEGIHVLATVRYLDGQPWLTIKRMVPPWEVGTVQPRYPRGSRIQIPPDPEPGYAEAEAWIMGQWKDAGALDAGGPDAGEPDGTLGQLLREVHQPRSVVSALAARRAAEDRLARDYIDHLIAQHDAALTVPGVWRFPPDAGKPGAGKPDATGPDRFCDLLLATPPGRALSPSQRQAVQSILCGMTAGRRLWKILSGDVGCGKTAVFLSVVAQVVSAGGRVLIIEPTRPLANQVQNVFRRDVCQAGLIDAAAAARVTIDTVGALHDLRAGRSQPFDLVVLDEQQKYSVAQKVEAAHPAAHVLEVTATLIPRSQTLARIGIIPVVTLDPLPVPKDIRTVCYRLQEAGQLLAWVERYLAENPGQSVLVVYPERDAKQDDSIRDAERAGAWWGKRYPAGVVHGATPDAEVTAILDRVAGGEIRVLVATTLVEIGLDLPSLGAVVVGHAERFGLATLHQIRGRVARGGGVGHCLMLCGEKEDGPAWDRLARFAATASGEEVAEIDRVTRRSGDLLAEGLIQHGDPGPILGLDLEAWLDRNVQWIGERAAARTRAIKTQEL